MELDTKLNIPSLLLSLLAVAIALLSLWGTYRSGGFDKPEYSTDLNVELIPTVQAWQLEKEEESANYVALKITNHHSANNAVINAIGGIIDDSGQCRYFRRMFRVIPENTEFPIVLTPGEILGPNPLDVMLKVSGNTHFPVDAYDGNPPENEGWGQTLSHVCLMTADPSDMAYSITGPIVPLPSPPEELAQ